ncbi:MAG: rhomboid family intramembrane serine protease [Silanimonas lenta]
MDATPTPDLDPRQLALAQRRRLQGALLGWLGFVALLGVMQVLSIAWPGLRSLGVVPLSLPGLSGLLAAPLLHADAGHLLSNAFALVVLGTLVSSVYPKAAPRIVLAGWLGAGLFTWLLGRPSIHLGASGLVHALFFALFALALLRRDRPAVVAAMVAVMLFGGMLLTVLPQEWRVSWEMHAGGALSGLLAAWRWRRLDPPPPRRLYSWEEEERAAEALAEARAIDAATYEPARPETVPVLWQRPEPREERGTVLPFRRPPPEGG